MLGYVTVKPNVNNQAEHKRETTKLDKAELILVQSLLTTSGPKMDRVHHTKNLQLSESITNITLIYFRLNLLGRLNFPPTVVYVSMNFSR